MSDSLNATVIVNSWRLTISANAELELLDDEEPPRPPAVTPEVELDEELDDELVDDALDVVPAETESPGSRLASDTIVPLVGARSFVSASALLALCRLLLAL
jgi:hypothetical protein